MTRGRTLSPTAPGAARARRLLAAGLALAAALVATPVARAENAGDVRQESFRRLNEGIRQLKTGDARAAADNLCWVAARALSSHDAHWYCGLALIQARDPEGAVKVLEVASELEPKHLGTLVALGDAYLGVGNPGAARAAYYRALDVRKDYSAAWDGLARVAVATGEDTQALEFFGKALEANAADARTRIHRGEYQLSKNRVDEALDDAREAARLRPDDAEVQLGLARTLLRARLPDQALAPAREAIRLTPRDARAVALMSEIYLALDALPEAEEAARQALAIDPGFARAQVALAEALGRQGKLDDALAQLGETVGATAATRDDAGAALRREAQQRWRTRITELASLGAKASAGNATPADLLTLAETQIAIGRTAEAAALADAAVARASGDPVVARRAAFALGSAGRMLEAEKLLERIAEVQPLSAADLVNLGVLRELTGDPEGAGAAYRQALESGGDWQAQAGLARLALAAGDRAAATAALQALLAAGPPPDDSARVIEALRVLDPEARPSTLPADARKK
ncbi:MAG: tetratricopeptide repeat protein [Acidobacteria bacterium]|nr:tetratricopeptide repeat protein [Acidobacteriota bacterium]